MYFHKDKMGLLHPQRRMSCDMQQKQKPFLCSLENLEHLSLHEKQTNKQKTVKHLLYGAYVRAMRPMS